MLRFLSVRTFASLLYAVSACGSHEIRHDDGPAKSHRAEDPTPDKPITAPTPGSLYDAYIGHEVDAPQRIDRYELTRDAKRVVESALSFAMTNDADALLHLATPDATWGLPDRAKRGARPLDQNWVDELMAGLRGAADRFARRSPYRCAVLSPAASGFVRSGAEPMWCYYARPDNTEHLVFELVMRDDRARVQYLGFFVDEPMQRIVVADGDVPPDHPPLKRRNLEMTRRNIPAADPRLQQMRLRQKQAATASDGGDNERGRAPTEPPGPLGRIAPGRPTRATAPVPRTPPPSATRSGPGE
ncbi:MAG: hypothetical protein B7733_14910 [Myxococcales bacterium FL481]|nr:MAG: hypothetical protein B7733_14910 [Myxococcales bacterium FL481]